MSVITSWGATPNRMKIALKLVSGSGQEGMTSEAMQQMLLPAALASSRSEEEPQGGSAIGDEVISELRNLGLLIQAGDGCFQASPEAVDVSEDGVRTTATGPTREPHRGRQPRSEGLPHEHWPGSYARTRPHLSRGRTTIGVAWNQTVELRASPTN